MLYNDKVQNRISLDHHTGKIPRTQPQSSTGLIADIIKRERERKKYRKEALIVRYHNSLSLSITIHQAGVTSRMDRPINHQHRCTEGKYSI